MTSSKTNPRELMSESLMTSSKSLAGVKTPTHDDILAPALDYQCDNHPNCNYRTQISQFSCERSREQPPEGKRWSCGAFSSSAYVDNRCLKGKRRDSRCQEISETNFLQNNAEDKHDHDAFSSTDASLNLSNIRSVELDNGPSARTTFRCQSCQSCSENVNEGEDCKRTAGRIVHIPSTYRTEEGEAVTDCKGTQSKYDLLLNSSSVERLENDELCVDNESLRKRRPKTYLERDEIINEYQFHEMMCYKAMKRKLDENYTEIQKLRRNYSSLKKLFLALAIINIILILCVVSIMPVILVTFKLSDGDKVHTEEDVERVSAQYLSSPEAKRVVKEHVLCVDCSRINEKWSDIFQRQGDKGCCVQDSASFVDQILRFYEKKLQDFDTGMMRKNKHYMFNSSFNGSDAGVILARQNEETARLVNTLLTRKRSAVHLSGTVRHHNITWELDLPRSSMGSLRLRNNAIQVDSGGIYFMYSCIRFASGKCGGNQAVGYRIYVNRGSQHELVTSIQEPCKHGKIGAIDLNIERIINIPVNAHSSTSLEIVLTSTLASQNHLHSFGLFEI